jgi:hypothetical protein
MRVRSEDKDWEESSYRERVWAPLDEAFGRLRKHPVKPLLRKASARLQRTRRRP